MKNRVVEIDDNVVALEIIYRGTWHIKQNAQNVSITLNSTTKCRNITIEDGKYRVRIGGHSFGRYNTLEEAQEVVRRERKIYFLYPLS